MANMFNEFDLFFDNELQDEFEQEYYFDGIDDDTMLYASRGYNRHQQFYPEDLIWDPELENPDDYFEVLPHEPPPPQQYIGYNKSKGKNEYLSRKTGRIYYRQPGRSSKNPAARRKAKEQQRLKVLEEERYRSHPWFYVFKFNQLLHVKDLSKIRRSDYSRGGWMMQLPHSTEWHEAKPATNKDLNNYLLHDIGYDDEFEYQAALLVEEQEELDALKYVPLVPLKRKHR